MNQQTIADIVNDEVAGFDYIEKLHDIDLVLERSRITPMSKSQALRRAAETVQRILFDLEKAEVDFNDADAGHALGHMARDYANALRLLIRQDVPAEDIFIGFLGGILHDIGCSVVERYEEGSRAIRHAEAGALLMEQLFDKDAYGLNWSEQLLIEYAIAAHTHYLREDTVLCADGVERTVRPYVDTVDGEPILGIWIPRWIDRLDINGPTFVGRHYLTRVVSREDFDGESHYVTDFAEHMRPLLRGKEEIKADGNKRTMREHLAMFADSQNASSPYGAWDHVSPAMVELRDAQTARLRRIIDAIEAPVGRERYNHDATLASWEAFLAGNVEPSEVGAAAARQLRGMFRELDVDTRSAWVHGFAQTMQEYIDWAEAMRNDLSLIAKDLRMFPPIGGYIEEIIEPAALVKQFTNK